MASDPPRPPDADIGAAAPPPGRDPNAEQRANGPLWRRQLPGRAAGRQRRGHSVGRLNLGDAIHDGWQAFCRAPRVFAAFALVVNLAILLQQPLLWHIGSVARPSTDPRDWALYGLGLAVMAALFLWGSLGLGRGAVLALQGQRPTLAEMLRWDGRAWLRLLRGSLRLTAMAGLPGALGLLLFGLPLVALIFMPDLQAGLGPEGTRLLALLLLALLALLVSLSLMAMVYLTVNQAFLLQIVLLEGSGGSDAVERGRRLVDPHWPLVLLLVSLMTLLNGLGLLACGVGSLAAWPAVICISTAAYRQLCEGERLLAETAQPATDPAGMTGARPDPER